MWYRYTIECSAQFSSVTQSCPTLCDPMNRSMPGLPVHHQLPEITQTHAHRVSDAIHPISSSVVPFSSCPNPSQHQSFPTSQLFTWGGQSIRVSASASVLPTNITSAIKKNEIMAFAATWIHLQIITLSEVRERGIIWHHFYVESIKMIQINLFQNGNRLTDLENKLMIWGKFEGRKKLGLWS